MILLTAAYLLKRFNVFARLRTLVLITKAPIFATI